MSIRVLHVLDHSIPLHSGYTFRTREILRHQAELGFETCHLTGAKQGRSPSQVEESDGLTFHRTRAGRLARLPLGDQVDVVLGLRRRLDELVGRLRPDLVHAHSPALNGLAAMGAARRAGLPFCYEIRAFWEDAAVDHGTTTEGSLRYRLTRALETHVVRGADAVFTIAEGLRDDLIARGTPVDKITLIPNAVDARRFAMLHERDAELERELGLDGCFVVGFLGSFYRYEGLTLLLDAASALKTSLPRLRVLLVGGGPEEERLHEQASALGLDDTVRFVGRVPHDQIERYYSLVDLLAFPRLSMRLTELVTPLKPLEAMAMGKPVLASDVGGHRELIRHEGTGILFDADDSSALADAISVLAGDAARRQRLVEAGRRFVEQERSWKAVIANYAPVYRGLCGQV